MFNFRFNFPICIQSDLRKALPGFDLGHVAAGDVLHEEGKELLEPLPLLTWVEPDTGILSDRIIRIFGPSKTSQHSGSN